MAKNVIILTAKGGNTTVQNKNIVPILGVPVFLYPLRAALLSRRAEAVYVTTEDPDIKSMTLKNGAQVIDRPADLSRSDSLHKDVIAHAVAELEKVHPDLENVVVLLGNTVQLTSNIIDQCFAELESGSCDSVATVWKAQDDHPFRALTVDDKGFAKSFLNVEVGSNRQSYPSVYFYDQGVWAFKKQCAHEQRGPSPWVWLGQRCKLLERPWVTGRDIHTWIDVAASAWYLTTIQANDLAPAVPITPPQN